MQKIITLGCQECKRRNYTTTKNSSAGGRFELKKYCRFCRKHTSHKEVK